jgi:5'-AMP-activated protein kinase regulatory beta subunit
MSSSRRSSHQGYNQHGAQPSPPVPGGAAPVGYKQQHPNQYPGTAALKKSTSDMSMTDTGDALETGGVSQLDIATIAAIEEDTVPTVFRWEHGGRNVYITGTFNGWSRQIPMHRSGNDFTYIHNLKRGKHAFKFIVDDEWRFAPDQPTVADIEGRINNFIDVTDFKAYTGDKEFEKERAAADYHSCNKSDKSTVDGDDSAASGKVRGVKDSEGEVYGHSMPDLDEYTKEPPPLPPHLRHIILNKPPQLQDTAALPVPQHVALNHLYCTAIKDNMMVLGITQRYKTKSCTTVYYSPC